MDRWLAGWLDGRRFVDFTPHRHTFHGTRTGSEGWYAWSFLVPEGYPEDEDPTTRWQIVTQFHDQPDLAAGVLCLSGGVMCVFVPGSVSCVVSARLRLLHNARMAADLTVIS